MEKENSGYCILIADDDNDDLHIIKQAFSKINFHENIQTVNDGAELFDYLHKKGKYKTAAFPVPKIIMLDLNMPKKDGRECLKELKQNPLTKRTPIIIYSTSSNPEDIHYAYDNGANSYIVKPYSYQELLKIMEIVKQYWLTIVTTATT